MSSHTIFITLALCVGGAAYARLRYTRASQQELSSADALQMLIYADAASVSATQKKRVREFVTELDAEFGKTVRFDEHLDGSFYMNLRDTDVCEYLGGIFTSPKSPIKFFITPYCPQPLRDALKAIALKEQDVEVEEPAGVVMPLQKKFEIANALRKKLDAKIVDVYYQNRSYRVKLWERKHLAHDFCGYIYMGTHSMDAPVTVHIVPNCPEPVRSMMRALADPPTVVVQESPMDPAAAAY